MNKQELLILWKSKKQAPLSNLNLWNMFVALGQGLLKDNGKIAYIIPQSLLHTKTIDIKNYSVI